LYIANEFVGYISIANPISGFQFETIHHKLFYQNKALSHFLFGLFLFHISILSYYDFFTSEIHFYQGKKDFCCLALAVYFIPAYALVF
jgi:hypothetical protein